MRNESRNAGAVHQNICATVLVLDGPRQRTQCIAVVHCNMGSRMPLTWQTGDQVFRGAFAVVVSNDTGGARAGEMPADRRTNRARAANNNGNMVLQGV